MELNNRIQKIMAYSSLSSSEFADEIGVQRSNISHIISGRNKPSLDFIMKIKNRFPEIKWEWIIEGKGNMTDDISEEINTTSNNENSNASTDEEIMPNLFSSIEYENSSSNNDDIDSKIITNEKENATQNYYTNKEKFLKENYKEIDVPKNDRADKIKKIVFFYENGKFEAFEP